MTDDEIRAEAVSLLTDTCEVQRITETKGTSGGNIQASSVVVSGVPCLYSPKGTREGLIAGQAQSAGDGTVYLPGVHNGAQLDIQGRDKIVIDENEAQAERTFSVIGAPRNFQGIIIEAPVAFAE